MTPLSKKLIVVGAAGVTLAGCTLPFGLGDKLAQKTGPQGKIEQVANAATLGVMMSTGKSGVCTMTNTADANAGTSEITVKGKKFRMKGQNFGGSAAPQTAMYNPSTTVTPAAAKIGYMINDGEFMYIWEDQATTGLKVKLTPSVTPMPKVTQANTASGKSPADDEKANPLDKFETDSKYRIDCKLGDVDDATFVPPTTVKFMEFGQPGQAGNSVDPGFEIDPQTKKPVMPKISLPARDYSNPNISNDAGE